VGGTLAALALRSADPRMPVTSHAAAPAPGSVRAGDYGGLLWVTSTGGSLPHPALMTRSLAVQMG